MSKGKNAKSWDFQTTSKTGLTKLNEASVIRLKTIYNINNQMLPVEVANLLGNNLPIKELVMHSGPLTAWLIAEAQYIMTSGYIYI